MSWLFELALTPALVAQAMRTRARLLRLPEAAGDRAGRCGEGPRLRLLTAGDSSAAGVGGGAGRVAPDREKRTDDSADARLVATG